MLIRFGYEKQNIRILSDVCGGFHGLADPTRENIFSSLDWLASDTAPGDYRFFHFSGHGERILQDKDHGQAKQARRVVTDRSLREPGALFDNELDMKGYGATPTRITEQTILTEELAYYNEAIVTRNTELRPGEQGPASRIMDHELNNCLSKLPPESILTCVIDCCASGRILNTNTKVSGAGFRGRRDPPVRRPEAPQSPQPSQSQPWPESQPQPQTESRPDSRPEPRPQPRPQSPPQFLPQPSPELNLNLAGSLDGLEEETNQEELISSQVLNGSINIASELAEAISSVLPGGVTSDVAGESSGLALQRDFYIKMQEEIPIKERQMDHIQAKIFGWTGCHQRQDTWGHDDLQPYGWGIFTRVFTQAFEANLAALTNNHQAHNGYVLNYNELFIHIRLDRLPPQPYRFKSIHATGKLVKMS
ncbi:hypothetical protein FRC12_016772 [Ceratobasidium sp. 428]|nr:hypothetical protein FRC12_016772 [Ceratobasidium sp. 428]